MTLINCRHNVSRGRHEVLVPGLLLAVVALLFSPSAAAQTCTAIDNGQNRGKCAKAGAACKSGGTQGVCTTSGVKGEYECDCKTPPPPPPPPVCSAVPPPPPPPPAFCANLNVCPANAALANQLFYIQDLGGGRCIDAGPPQSWAPGSPVFINACNHTIGQEIRVTEIDSHDHDVGLAVYPTPTNAPPSAHLAVTAPTAPGTTSTGATNAGFCIGVHGGTVAANAALELQTCNNPLSPAQRFAVDGDAILMGSQTTGTVTRDFVIERQNGSTVPQTPLVVATRVLGEEEPLRIDARYFLFKAVDGSAAAPTSGFLNVASVPNIPDAEEKDLVCAAQCGWGTVVQIDESQPLVLTKTSLYPPPQDPCIKLGNIEVADGTTIRGYRRQTDNGPQVQTCIADNDWPVFEAGGQAAPFTGQAVRFTGFRLLGPNSGCNPEIGPANEAEDTISVVQSPDGSLPLPSVWIDHMEISYWPGHGSVGGGGLPYSQGFPNAQPGPCPGCGYPDTPIALAVGNFMHDDKYEVGSGGPSFVQIRGNLFYGATNQPVTTRQMSCLGGYAAMDNLFLTEVGSASSDDVDIHGSYPSGDWSNGLTGDYFDVGWNTFLNIDKTIAGGVVGNFIANVNQRGYSCRFIEIHNNVFLQPEGNAIRDAGNPPAPVEYGNSFTSRDQDPTLGPLLVGDFDGDGIDDVFLATGAAWYYSSGGRAEWRYLNRASEPASALLLGDFDGDGRTDVLAVHGPNIDVSWAGVSAWQTINQTAWPLADLAVGDFEGVGRSDLLLATGTQWFLAPGGQNWKPWPVPYTNTISNLRFGHFAELPTDKTKTQTQILRLGQNHHWEVTEFGMTSWTDIGPAPVDSVSGLVAGDFNGDGYADLAQSVNVGSNGAYEVFQWQYTSPWLSSTWSSLGTSMSRIEFSPIGNFQGGKQDGVITWGGGYVFDNHFYFTHAPQNQPQLQSRQVMR
jgi:hypothetical protein